MRLEKDILELLTRATDVARQLGILEIAMEDSSVGKTFRGMSDAFGTPIVIVHQFNEDIPFGSMAIRDTKSFIDKLDLAKDRDQNFRVFVEVNENRNTVSSIEMKGSRFKMNFLAGQAEAVRAPKRLKEVPICRFQMTEDALEALQKAIRAMGGEYVTFVSDGQEVSFEIKAGKTDTFTYTFANAIESLDGSTPTFAYSYPVKAIVKFIRGTDDGQFSLSPRGILTCSMEQISVSLFPRV